MTPRTPHAAAPARVLERRNVCVLSQLDGNQAERMMQTHCNGTSHTHLTRGAVLDGVATGRMRFVDRYKNMATYTTESAGSWQKCQSGPVATMQFKVGAKGRYVPMSQRDADLDQTAGR